MKKDGVLLVKIEISKNQLINILKSGVIYPSDINCLDSDTKTVLRELCIQMCKAKSCATCPSREGCEQISFQSERLPLVVTKTEASPEIH